jgi:Kef-type K+ transport system membrane component KefB
MLVGYLAGIICGLTQSSSMVLGAAMMFSSTIIGIKLLPTTILHHQHTGEVMISVLLFQDILAIFTLLSIFGSAQHSQLIKYFMMVVVGFPLVCAGAFLVQRFVIIKLLVKFDRVREYMFLVAIAWCLTLAQLASVINLSAEIGAFIAGVTLASSPVSLYIAESLKPIRDFFLVMFFFSVGASFDLLFLPTIWKSALVLAFVMMVLKPVVFHFLLKRVGESGPVSWEVGVRLAQVSEFSLIISYMAKSSSLINAQSASLIQAVTIVTFIISSYWVVLCYPTPLAFSRKMLQD